MDYISGLLALWFLVVQLTGLRRREEHEIRAFVPFIPLVSSLLCQVTAGWLYPSTEGHNSCQLVIFPLQLPFWGSGNWGSGNFPLPLLF